MANYVLEQEFYDFLTTKLKIKTNSASSYAHNYLPSWQKYLSNYPFEKDFLEVIPYLLSLGKFEECTQVLLRVYRAVQIEAYSGGKTLKNYRSAFNKYAVFIQRKYIKTKTIVSLPAPFTLPQNISPKTITNVVNNGISNTNETNLSNQLTKEEREFYEKEKKKKLLKEFAE